MKYAFLSLFAVLAWIDARGDTLTCELRKDDRVLSTRSVEIDPFETAKVELGGRTFSMIRDVYQYSIDDRTYGTGPVILGVHNQFSTGEDEQVLDCIVTAKDLNGPVGVRNLRALQLEFLRLLAPLLAKSKNVTDACHLFGRLSSKVGTIDDHLLSHLARSFPNTLIELETAVDELKNLNTFLLCSNIEGNPDLARLNKIGEDLDKTLQSVSNKLRQNPLN